MNLKHEDKLWNVPKNKAVLSDGGGVKSVNHELMGESYFTFAVSIPIVLSSMTIPSENGFPDLSPAS